MLKILIKIILITFGTAVSLAGIGYSMELASSKSNFAFLGWVGFVVSIYLFWSVLTMKIQAPKKNKTKKQQEPFSSERDRENGNDPASIPNRA